MKKILALVSIFFLLIFSSVSIGASLPQDEILAGPTITFDPPAQVMQNEEFDLVASATGQSGIDIYLYKSWNIWDWTLLEHNMCPDTSCSITYTDSNSNTGDVYYKVKATDSDGTNTVIKTVEVIGDTEDPVIIHTEDPDSPATYAPAQVYLFNATVTDNTGLDSVVLEFDGDYYYYTNDGDDTNDDLIRTGDDYAMTFIGLASGTYEFSWAATDVNGNDADTGILTYEVLQADPIDPLNPILHLSLNDVEDDLTVAYGTETTALGWLTGGDEGAVTRLERDGSWVDDTTETDTFETGVYIYEFFYEATENYTDGSVSWILTVNKAAPNLQMIFDPVSPITYGTPLTVTCTVDNTEQTPILYRDGVEVPEIGIPVVLAADTYQYECEVLESDNYEAASTGLVAFVVDKAVPVLDMTADPSWTTTYPQSITVTATESNEGDADLTYYLAWTYTLPGGGGGTGGAAPNPAPMTVSESGTYTFEYSTAGGENYTAGTTGPIPAAINQATPVLDIIFSEESPITYGTPLIADCTVDNAEQSPILYRNGIDVTATEKGQPVILAAGDHVYTCEVLESTNYLATTAGPETFTVDKANPINDTNPEESVIHLTLNGFEADLVISEGDTSVALGWSDIPDGTLTLYLDGVDVGGLTDTQTFPTGNYNYTLTLTGAQNYTDADLTRWVLVADDLPPVITITHPLNGANTSNETWLNATTNEPATCYFGPATGPTDPMDSQSTLHSTYLTGLPLGENTYYVRCVDAFGNEAEESVTWNVGIEQEIPVVMGWNLISLAVVPFEPVLTSDAAIWGTNYIIQHYDTASDAWLEYDSSNPGVATLDEVVPDKGYWLYVDTDRTIIILGEEPGMRTVNLLQGINMIGWTSLDSKQMDLALDSIIVNVSWVRLQNTTDMSQKLLQDAVLNSDSFEPGKGYFINVTNDTQWIYPQNVPPVADAGADQSAYVGDTVVLDGSGSTDADGTIVLYEWTIGTITKTGITPTFTFSSAGTYTITLTVTDDQGATDTDTVDIVVSSYYRPRGSPGGDFAPPDSGFIIIELEAPETVTVTQGTPETFIATVTNVGDTNVYDIEINGDPDWITVVPLSVTQLKKNESADFEVTITLPAGVIGTNYLTLTATGRHENTTAESSVSIEIIGNPEGCDECPEPSEWSACVNGTQERTTWTCDESTGYACVETTETRACGGLTGYFLFITDNPLLSGIVGIIIIGAIAALLFAHRKGKTKGIKDALSRLFKPKKTDGKKQGIDFSIEYKKSFDDGVPPATL